MRTKTQLFLLNKIALEYMESYTRTRLAMFCYHSAGLIPEGAPQLGVLHDSIYSNLVHIHIANQLNDP